MTEVVNLYDESIRLKQSGLDVFYTPAFEVLVERAHLPNDVLRDVMEITYKDNISQIDSFELVVNNWDAGNHIFKYVGSETASDLEGSDEDSMQYRLFNPCGKEVVVKMGYVGEMRVMLTGNFTTMEPIFTAAKPPTLNVRGLNVLHQLRRKQNTRTWTDKKDSEIVQSMASDLPIPVRTDSNAMSSEPVLSFLAQRNAYDIDFISTRARVRGYVVFINETDDGRELYFGPSQSGMVPGLRDVVYELEWGKSIIDFKPTMTTANQVKSVTVNGWNRRTRSAVSSTVDINDQELNRNQDLHAVLGKCDPREEIVVDEPVSSEQEARSRAIAILNDRQKEMVKASGTTIGLPDLRAGSRLIIRGLGARFSGVYFVTDTTHTINDKGYLTQFNARREDNGETER